MSKKQVLLDYDEHQKLLNNQKDSKEYIRIQDIGSYYSSLYRVDMVTTDEALLYLKERIENINSDYARSIKDKESIIGNANARLTRLENRNWFERLFNIDM